MIVPIDIRRPGVMKVALLFAILCGTGFIPATAGAATASVAGPNDFGQLSLRYVADAGEANHVFVDFSNGFSGVDVTDSGATIAAGPGCVTLGLHKVRCDVSSGDLVNASLGDGDDIFSISLGLDTGGGRLSGGDGDDRIRGNNVAGTNEILLGGRGADSLFGRGGSELLDGGPGGDDLSGGTSCEPLTAGQCATDVDIVSYAGRTRNVHADADGTAGDDGYRREGDTIMDDVERLIGGRGDDHLGATTTSFGILEGHAGDDVLTGARASDRVSGGPGDDVLRGEGGLDLLLGGRGRDLLLAQDGQSDHVHGGRGSDKGRVDRGLDRVRGVETFL
jgi:Ca2+-binding RTX toxin-like protein